MHTITCSLSASVLRSSAVSVSRLGGWSSVGSANSANVCFFGLFGCLPFTELIPKETDILPLPMAHAAFSFGTTPDAVIGSGFDKPCAETMRRHSTAIGSYH